MTMYLVRGPLRYREHEVGETFEAELDPMAEARALELGTIVVVRSSPTRIRPGSYRLPAGWQEKPGAPEGALLIEGSKS